jgi:predicted Zn-dependent protease
LRRFALEPEPSTARSKTARLFASMLFSCLLPVLAIAHGGFELRIAEADRAVSTYPAAPRHRLARAELHRRHGDFSAALRDLEQARELAPDLHSVEFFRGLVYLDSDRPEKAEATLRRFLELEPEHPAGHEARARALLRLERPLDAAREYDLVIAQQPVPIPEYYLERARAFAAAGDKYLDEAVRGLDDGIASIGPVVTLERAAIDLDVRRGAIEAALARLERIIEQSTRRETWRAMRGELLMRLGRAEEARQSFDTALAELRELPPERRGSFAMSRLETRIQKNMAGLAARERGTAH